MPENGKKSNQIIIKELPDRYPRTEEILIFTDMGELDHVFGLLDDIKEKANSKALDITDAEWRELINYSGIYNLMHVLRKACFEYERFWIDEDDWNLEEDEDFYECMNDPDELQWLVVDLDFGRIKPIDGKNTRFYEPAYHAAARSLQLAMYTYRYRGDKEWVDYCIKELQQMLTRYHAAALEIVMHRENVYLQNNLGNIETVKKIRARSKERANDQKQEAAGRKDEALKIFKELWQSKKNHETKTSIAERVAIKMGLSVSSVWRYLKS